MRALPLISSMCAQRTSKFNWKIISLFCMSCSMFMFQLNSAEHFTHVMHHVKQWAAACQVPCLVLSIVLFILTQIVLIYIGACGKSVCSLAFIGLYPNTRQNLFLWCFSTIYLQPSPQVTVLNPTCLIWVSTADLYNECGSGENWKHWLVISPWVLWRNAFIMKNGIETSLC